MSEACYQQTHLEFATETTEVRYMDGSRPSVWINATTTSKGTWPLGSQWRKNPGAHVRLRCWHRVQAALRFHHHLLVFHHHLLLFHHHLLVVFVVVLGGTVEPWLRRMLSREPVRVLRPRVPRVVPSRRSASARVPHRPHVPVCMGRGCGCG